MHSQQEANSEPLRMPENAAAKPSQRRMSWLDSETETGPQLEPAAALPLPPGCVDQMNDPNESSSDARDHTATTAALVAAANSAPGSPRAWPARDYHFATATPAAVATPPTPAVAVAPSSAQGIEDGGSIVPAFEGGGANVPDDGLKPVGSSSIGAMMSSMMGATSDGLPAYAPGDNTKCSLETEDIRLEKVCQGVFTELGRGDKGGKIGGIKGKTAVTQETSAARSTLVVHQPGRPRGDDQYVPYITPKPVDKAGHTLFALDIPKVHGKTAKQVGKRASRIVINKNADRSAQICIESYSRGEKAKKGTTSDLGKYIAASSSDAITRETIQVSSFNVSEVQRVNITISTLSTLTEEKITVKYTESKAADRIKYHPVCGWLWCPEQCPFLASFTEGEECCCFCFTPNKCECCSWQSWCWKDGLCCFNPCSITCLTHSPDSGCCCGSPIACWTDEMVVGKTKTDSKEESKALEPFDLVSVTAIEFILRDASHVSSEENSLKFVWRVQSIGETETDLKYSLAEGLTLPCQDPTSTARTLANVIHYLNA